MILFNSISKFGGRHLYNKDGKVGINMFENVQTPCYIVDEAKIKGGRFNKNVLEGKLLKRAG